MKITPFTYDSLAGEEAKASAAAMMAGNLADSEESEIEIIAPSYSEEELEEAKKQAHDDGFMAGKKEGVREAEMKGQKHQDEVKGILDTVSAALKDLQQDYQDALQQRQPEIGKLVYACTQKIAGEAMQKNPIEDISLMVEECLAGLFDAPQIEAVVHPDIVESLRTSLPEEISITADESLQLTDCKLQWQHGHAMRDTASLWNEIEQVIARHFANPMPAKKLEEPVNDVTEEAPTESTDETAPVVEEQVIKTSATSEEGAAVVEEVVTPVAEEIAETHSETVEETISVEQEIIEEPETVPETTETANEQPTQGEEDHE